jgi:hypothetical protein
VSSLAEITRASSIIDVLSARPLVGHAFALRSPRGRSSVFDDEKSAPTGLATRTLDAGGGIIGDSQFEELRDTLRRDRSRRRCCAVTTTSPSSRR